MSRFGMGFGKDHPNHIKEGRPALTNLGTRRQRVLNDWFEVNFLLGSVASVKKT